MDGWRKLTLREAWCVVAILAAMTLWGLFLAYSGNPHP